MKKPPISGMPIDPKDIVDQEVQTYQGTNKKLGIAVGLVQGNTTSYFNFGMANQKTGALVSQNTIFVIASVQKVFTSTLCASLVVQNKMDLSAQITNYLPKDVGKKGSAIRQVTPLDLATMTSGMSDRTPLAKHPGYNLYNNQPPSSNFIAYWQNKNSKGFNPTYKIGTKERYSNIGVVTLGFATAGAAGCGYTTLLQETITGPLEMADTVIKVPNSDKDRVAQGYNKKGNPARIQTLGINSTTQDLVRFLTANLFLTNMLPPHLVQAMSLAQTPHFHKSPTKAIGLNWYINPLGKNTLISKNGGNSGFLSYVGFIPQLQMGIVLLSNGKSDVQKLPQLGANILSLLSNNPKCISDDLLDNGDEGHNQT